MFANTVMNSFLLIGYSVPSFLKCSGRSSTFSVRSSNGCRSIPSCIVLICKPLPCRYLKKKHNIVRITCYQAKILVKQMVIQKCVFQATHRYEMAMAQPSCQGKQYKSVSATYLLLAFLSIEKNRKISLSCQFHFVEQRY